MFSAWADLKYALRSLAKSPGLTAGGGRDTGARRGIRSTDPAAYAGVILLVAAIAVAATYLPARRATRTDPIRALRAP